MKHAVKNFRWISCSWYWYFRSRSNQSAILLEKKRIRKTCDGSWAQSHSLLFWVSLGCLVSYTSDKAAWYLPTFLPFWTLCKGCSSLSRFARSTKKSVRTYIGNLSLARYLYFMFSYYKLLFTPKWLLTLSNRGSNVWHFTLTSNWVTCKRSRHKTKRVLTRGVISVSSIHHRTIIVKYRSFLVDCIKVLQIKY